MRSLPLALRISLALVSIVALGLWLVAAAQRVAYPFALEWIEGAMLIHADRVLAGEPLYMEPALAFTALPYPPLFAWCGALVQWVFGDGLQSLRLVSLLGTALLCVCLFLAARRGEGDERHSRLSGVVALGVLFAGHAWAGAFLDVARNDALYLGLVMACFVLQQGKPSVVQALGAGLLGAAACLAKQSAAAPVGLMFLALLLRAPRAGALAGLSCASILFSVWLMLLAQCGEWLNFHLFEVLREHPWYVPGVRGFWFMDMPWLLPACVATVLAGGVLRRSWNSGAGALVLGLLIAAWGGRAHIGGYDNVLLPALVAVALLAGQCVGSLENSAGFGRRSQFAAALVLLQILIFAAGPETRVPTSEDRAAGEALVARIAQLPGEVLIPAHPELARMAGKAPSAHWMTILDLSASGDGKWGVQLVGELREALKQARYSVVILDQVESMSGPARELFAAHLVLFEQLFPHTPRMLPVTGIPAAPAEWWVPR